ncbi:MAG TPA: pantetheine-phosphate adenylyltransferase [Bacteroidales bacterium]|nr:pantetheine-phosphate adenylyltransferase [Bacteroidales bacterium]
MNKIAVFPGSFDPITKGHENILLRALPLFDEIVIAVGTNQEKKSLFPIEKRLNWISKTFEKQPNITVVSYEGLTVDLCKKIGARFILRGLRTSADFEFERSIGQINRQLNDSIETVFLLTSTQYTAITSSLVREVFINGGKVSDFVPEGVVIS